MSPRSHTAPPLSHGVPRTTARAAAAGGRDAASSVLPSGWAPIPRVLS